MSRGAPSDLANELNGAGELLLSLTANGEDRDEQLKKLFGSFNARVSKLPHGTPRTLWMRSPMRSGLARGPIARRKRCWP